MDCGKRFDEQFIQPSGLIQRVDGFVPGPAKKIRVGIKELIEPVYGYPGGHPFQYYSNFGSGFWALVPRCAVATVVFYHGGRALPPAQLTIPSLRVACTTKALTELSQVL